MRCLSRALLALPNALQALGSRLPPDRYDVVRLNLLLGALHVASSCMRLARALDAPRDAASRNVQASTSFQPVVGAVMFGFTTRWPVIPPPTTGFAVRQNRYALAIELLKLMRGMTMVCQSPEASLEVLAAAVPPEKLLPLLHGAAQALLDALEAGALAGLAHTLFRFVLTACAYSCVAHMPRCS
jgi:hypothetical protein